MKFIKDIYIEVLSFFNYPFISAEILTDIKGPILLHISDTPVDIYNYIFRVIEILKPEYIIHTGDLADNIKLEINPNRIGCYNKGVTKLIEGLEKNDTSKVYYVLGNHDNYQTVSQLTQKGIILDEGPLTINDCKFTVGHYHKDYSYQADFNLFGHSPEPNHYRKDGTYGLNGLLNINIIDLSNKKVYHLDYPIGTNSARRMEIKGVGL